MRLDAQRRKEVIEYLREAGDILEGYSDEEVIMPGWDEQFISDRTRGIQIAAEAVRARGRTPDEGTRVHTRDLGYLVRYVADMLEE